MTLALAAFILTSCGGGEGGDGDNGGAATATYNSDYFADVMYASGGDFADLNIGDTREEVKAKLPESAFVDESGGYMYYEWLLDNNDYYLDLYFDDNDKLNSIDGAVHFYDADDYYDRAEAKKFYEDMRDYLTDSYGPEEEENDGDYVYTYWYMDDMDVEVGLDEGECYWYIYYYEDYDI